MRPNQLFILIGRAFLFGVFFLAATFSFAQSEPIEFHDFKESNSMPKGDVDRFIELTESTQSSVFVTSEELFPSEDGGAPIVVSVRSDAYQNLNKVSEKSSVEAIMVFYEVGAPLPSSSHFTQFPSLKYVIYQGASLSPSVFQGSWGAENGAPYLIFRVVGND